MNNNIYFILILLFIMIISINLSSNENFQTTEKGVFNYFYQLYLNPYPEPMIKFFSNDKVK